MLARCKSSIMGENNQLSVSIRARIRISPKHTAFVHGLRQDFRSAHLNSTLLFWNELWNDLHLDISYLAYSEGIKMIPQDLQL